MGLSRTVTQSPAGYDSSNLTGNASKRASIRTRMQDAGYRFKIHAAETAAGLVEANLTFGYDPGDARRYGDDPTGVADSLAAINLASLVSNNGGGPAYLCAGTHKATGKILLYAAPNLGQSILQGAGRVACTINYTGSGTAVGTNAASTRIYDCAIRDLTILNGGTGTVGIDFDSVSTSHVQHVTVSNFATAVWIHSTINGGCVYNRFIDCTAQMPAVPTVGFFVDTKGSNATTFLGCRYNGPNNTSGTAWQIVDSSGTSISGCNIDNALVGFALSSPSGAGFCDANLIYGNRVELVATIYTFAANVRYTKAGPNQIETFTTLYTDAGTRNNIFEPPIGAFENYAPVGAAAGNRVFSCTSSIGANPFFVINDTATATVGSTVLQVETSSVNQTIIRARTSGADKFTVSGIGGIGCYGAAPTTQPTGYGTPTGNALISSFAAGTITLPQLAAEVAQLVIDLKKSGLIGA